MKHPYDFELFEYNNTMISEILENISKRIHIQANSIENGLTTGFKDLDRLTQGLGRSDLILLASRPEMGKTAMALSILKHVITESKKPAVYFSLESSKEQIVKRLLAMIGEIEYRGLVSGCIPPDDWEQYCFAVETLKNTQLLIDDTPFPDLTELENRCRKYKAKQKIQFIVVDYLQLIYQPTYSFVQNDHVENACVSRGLKELTEELEVPILVLSQVSRAIEHRANPRPEMKDIISFDAGGGFFDLVWILYRDEYYNAATGEKNIAELNVARNPRGSRGILKLEYEPNFLHFVNLPDGSCPR